MPMFKDITGKRFGRFLVLRLGKKTSKGTNRWVCQCDCGGTALIGVGDIRVQKYCSSCKPKGRPSHGLSHLPEWSVWSAMKQRCNNPKCESYENYGARGISYCERWEQFENFIEDMGRRPNDDYTLERKENNGNYNKGNCVWATRVEQARNFRSNVILEFNGQKKCISEWGEIYGVKHDTISSRIERGWSIEAAITTPPNQKYNHQCLIK